MIELTVLNDSNVELNTVDDGLIGLDVVMATGGGSEIHNQDKTVTPTESEQSVTADVGYTGLGTVTVEGIDSEYVGSDIPRNTSSDLLTEGATVIAPSGYYENSATKTVQMGTAGTPTASKGAVSNHSVSVTPSVTNQAGYIYSETKTGTAVTVSASELVSGTKSITQNGTEDVTNYASVSVSVPNTYTAGDEGKVVSSGALVAQTSDTVTQNDTYDTTLINSLTVNVSSGDPNENLIKKLSNTLTSLHVDLGGNALGQRAMDSCTSLQTAFVSGLTISNSAVAGAWYAFNGCISLKTLVMIRSTSGVFGAFAVSGCKLLEKVDLSNFSSLNGSCFASTAKNNFKTLILRRTSIVSLSNVNAFNDTPFKSGGTGGTIYIPKSLYDHLNDGTSLDYKSATNWSTVNGYGTITWAKIEGSNYENSYADGTPIS